MPFLLRKIRKSRWNELISASQISDEQLRNGPLIDLREPNSNELSVWDIGEDQKNLFRIVAALVGKWQFIGNFDYLIFDRQLLVEVGIEWERTEGESADAEANTSWHVDLKDLTDEKRLQLARLILEKKSEIGRIPEKKICELLGQSLAKGHVQLHALSEKMRSQKDRFCRE